MNKFVALGALMASLATPAMAQTAPMAVPTDREGFRQMAMMSDAFEITSSQLALERSRNPRVRAYAQQMINDHAATSQALNGGTAVYGASGQIVGGTATGALAGAGVGALVGGPVGAAVGADIGATTGATAGAAAESTGAVGTPIRTAVPLDARKAAMLNQLASTSGPQFDRLYGQAQRMAHQEALAVYTAYAQNGRDPAMVQYTQSVIPHLQQHAAAARRLPGGGSR
jgi:predicted outer membrane protein